MLAQTLAFAPRVARTASRVRTFASGREFDVVVIGGGHAGCDAATAAARTGAKTALVTQRADTIGELSCNPSIGGIGKGHLVREVDALDGVIGEAGDMAGIHFRVLNRRKGPAVRGPRAQADRDLYKAGMQSLIANTENLCVIEGGAEDLLLDEGDEIDSAAPIAEVESSGTDAGKAAVMASSKATQQERKARIRGVVLADGTEIACRAVVITTGTFLRGVLMIGKERYSGGRHLRDSEEVEPPSVGLAKTLARFGFELGRMKTGTPPRLDGTTIDWDACNIQPSEYPCPPFSYVRQFTGEEVPNAQNLIDCYQSCTNEETHKLVMQYAHTLPEYDGLDGKGNGPRYCPSLYKKVERFPDRNSHNSFLEPEGLNTNIVYPNGMSGPYPEEIQLKIMRTMLGLGAVEIVRPGYDVEYDFVNPQSLTHTLETKKIGGLYLAGQICGTTGYEEAAAQGVIAGANAGKAAGCAARGEEPPPPFVLGRDEAYIGVLIDDLVTKGTNEPYRMFTSRSEYRISLRADNADLRLTAKAADFGLVTRPDRLAALDARESMLNDSIDRLRSFKLFVSEWAERGGNDLMGGSASGRKGSDGKKKSGEEVLKMPHVTLKDVEDIMAEDGVRLLSAAEAMDEGDEKDEALNAASSLTPPTPGSVFDTVEATVKYSSYLDRQEKDMESWRKAQGIRIPGDLVYDHDVFPTFSSEEIEKLKRIRPATFADASNISGLTPQSLVYLYNYVSKRGQFRDRERNKRAKERFSTVE
eukprot:CAMPEP_0196816558 /NCGR_PEP_ID=MMETSP1362-20130617/56036_1 /TAXON_ID=163516 /ORGANISM="Leptocylindrus danicus, Strain CCMP1856" /LENGTH=756 /DNA_ID=CAMNT_0042193949 /DNA_START=79 /DNA_END=2349 /DNA_ORIENTATION=-